jgi:hypothetical protein
MLLGVALLFIGFQMAPTVAAALVPPSAVGASLPSDTTRTKLADPVSNTGSPDGDASNAMSGESSSTSSAAPLKIDSIYADDDGRRPGAVPVLAVQNSQSFSTIRIPEGNEKRYTTREAESVPSRKKWVALMILEHGAAAFDAYSTREAISRGAKEEDPLMRPFAHSPAIYAAIQVGPAILDLLAHHMQRSRYNFERRTWWVPQSGSTGVSIFSGVHNLNVVGHP